MNPLAHEDIQELLGAYALHAVDPDEAEVVERHLEGCPRCRAEVEGHREVATLIGNSGGDAPDGLWDRIASRSTSGSWTSASLTLSATERSSTSCSRS